MADENRLIIWEFVPVEEEVTLAGTSYAALAETPYAIEEVVSATTTAVTAESVTLLTSYGTSLANAWVERGTVTVTVNDATPPAGFTDGQVLVEGTDYTVDYAKGKIRTNSIGGPAVAFTADVDYTYRSAPYVRSLDGGTSGDWISDDNPSTFQGLKRTAGSTIPDPTTVLVRYEALRAVANTDLADKKFANAQYTFDAIGGCKAAAFDWLDGTPFRPTGVKSLRSEAWFYRDAPADITVPGTPQWAGVILPNREDSWSGQAIRYQCEGLYYYLQLAEIAPDTLGGTNFDSDDTVTPETVSGLRGVALAVLKNAAPRRVLIDTSELVPTEPDFVDVDDDLQGTNLWTYLQELATRAAADLNGTWAVGVGPDRKVFLKRRPTSVQETFQQATNGVSIDGTGPATPAFTVVYLDRPNLPTVRIEHPDLHDPTFAFYRWSIPGRFDAPRRMSAAEAEQYGKGLLAEFGRARVQVVVSEVGDDTSTTLPWEGEARLQHQAGDAFAVLPIQTLTVQFDGSYARTWTCGYRDPTTVGGGLKPLSRGHIRPANTYEPFAAQAGGSIANGASGTVTEIDPSTGSAITGGRSVTAWNLGLAVSSGDKFIVGRDEGGTYFFRTRGGLVLRYTVELWMDGSPIWQPADSSVTIFGATFPTGLTSVDPVQGVAVSGHLPVAGGGNGTSAITDLQVTQGGVGGGVLDAEFTSSGTNDSSRTFPGDGNDPIVDHLSLVGTGEIRIAWTHEVNAAASGTVYSRLQCLFEPSGAGVLLFVNLKEVDGGNTTVEAKARRLGPDDVAGLPVEADLASTVIAGGSHDFEWRLTPVLG